MKVVPSKTPIVCAKAAGSFLKAISKKVKSPEAALEFCHQLQSSLKDGESLSFGDIKKMSESFIDNEQICEVLAGISNKSGLEMSDNVEIDTRQLTRYARDVVKKSWIADGISVVISDQNANISAMEIVRNESGIRAVIDIQLKVV